MPTETGVDRQLSRLTFALTGLAALASELATAPPGRSPLTGLAITLGLTAWSAAIHLFLRRRARDEPVPRLSTAAAAALALGGLVAVDLGRSVAGGRLAPELWLLILVRDAGLVAAALAGIPVCLRIAGGISVALVLFAASLAEHRLIYPLLAAYSVLGSYWLILLHWNLLELKLLEGRSRRLPMGSVVFWGGMVCLATLVILGPRRTAGTLADLIGTSGGSERADPDARAGVGDGDKLARGQSNPESTGPVESDLFLESNERTLYDATNDQYGEPFKKREQILAKSVENQLQREAEEKSEQSKPTREFAVARNQPTRPRDLPRRAADAALYVTGPTPLHLRLVAFDQFDGTTWTQPAIVSEDSELELGLGGWLYPRASEASVFAGPVEHRIVVGTLDAPQLTLPAHLVSFRLETIDRPEFFRWGQAGILRLTRGKVPRQTILEAQSHTLDPVALRDGAFRSTGNYALPRFRSLPEGGLDPRVAALAREWAGAAPRGWAQVEAVLDGLRARCVHDPTQSVPADAADPVAHFLLASRRGDDYLFATAACLLLRELGYATRFVEGFYAAPGRYDPEQGQTPVDWHDLHTWAEVLLPTGDWIVVEATPGFGVLGPARPWFERALAALAAAGRWALARPVGSLTLLVLAGLTVHRRRQVLDGLETARWRLLSRGPSRRRVRATVRLLERRSGLAGRSRPPGRTLRAWYSPIGTRSDDDRGRILGELIELAEWASYAPGPQPVRWSEDEVRRRCGRVVRTWTLATFRTAGQAGAA